MEQIWIPLTILRELQTYMKKHKLNENIILRNLPDVPEELTPTNIRSWIDETERNAQREHVKYVLDRLRHLTKRVPITPQIITQLNQERLRTGVGFKQQINLIRRQLSNHPNTRFSHSSKLPQSVHVSYLS